MAFQDELLTQDAVYWAPMPKPDGYGQPQYTKAVAVRVHWETSRQQYVAQDGTTKVSQAVVFVDQDVEAGGLLRLGTLAGTLNLTSPRENADVFEIQKFGKTPDLDGGEPTREVML